MSSPVGPVLVIDLIFDYTDTTAHAAGLLIPNITWSGQPLRTVHHSNLNATRTVPSEVHTRILPSLINLVEQCPSTALVIMNRPAVGARLYESLNGRIPIIGVGKATNKGKARAENEWAQRIGPDGISTVLQHDGTELILAPLFRSSSSHPLNVSASGISLSEAVALVKSMSGEFRVPGVLHQAEQAARVLGGKEPFRNCRDTHAERQRESGSGSGGVRSWRSRGEGQDPVRGADSGAGVYGARATGGGATRGWRHTPRKESPATTKVAGDDDTLEWRRRP